MFECFNDHGLVWSLTLENLGVELTLKKLEHTLPQKMDQSLFCMKGFVVVHNLDQEVGDRWANTISGPSQSLRNLYHYFKVRLFRIWQIDSAK